MIKGEIRTVSLPLSDRHEQHGVRPVGVVADTKSSIAMIIPFTSNPVALRLPYTLRVQNTKRNGLTSPSVLLVLQLRAIDKGRIHQKIGTLEKSVISEVDQTLKK